MKTKTTIFMLALMVGFNFGFSQQDQECMEQLSIFDTYRKQKKYDEAYGPWKTVREKCPKYSRAIYAYGDTILEHKIKNSTGAEQIAFIKDLMLLYDQSNQYFGSKYSKPAMLQEKADLAYKYRKELGKSDEDIFNMYDELYKMDKTSFTNPKGLYTYFSFMVDLYDGGKKTAQSMFDKYDDVNDVIQGIIEDYTKKLNVLVLKEDAGTALTKREGQYKNKYVKTIAQFEDKIIPSMDTKLGQRANCEVLVPLYQKDFETYKNDPIWLQRAVNKMYAKGCKEDPLFVKLVEQKYKLQPDADIAYYLYLLTDEQRYLDESLRMQTDPIKKSKLLYKLANELKSKGSYGKARQYYSESAKLNPSFGSPYLKIAAMYASSANNCGDTNFNKRAVFWLAANEARKAGRVDSRLKSAASQTATSYTAKAPSKSEIFSSGMAGKSIKIGCWIGRSVTVPSI